jgi:hypothetical protein
VRARTRARAIRVLRRARSFSSCSPDGAHAIARVRGEAICADQRDENGCGCAHTMLATST